MTYSEGKLGPLSGSNVALGADGSGITEERFSKQGGQYTVDLMPRYGEWCARGNLFFAANQAGGAVTALVAAATGLILTNPPGSGRILIPVWADFILSAAPAAASQIVLASAPAVNATEPTHTTPLTVRNARIGNAFGATGKADSSATVPVAPVVCDVLGGVVAVGSITPAPMSKELPGTIILEPGTYLAFAALAAASGIARLVWIELPLPT